MKRSAQVLALSILFAVVTAVHFAVDPTSEPFYNNDETRHVMTGIFFHDLYRDLPLSDPAGYACRYYAQYQALGLLVWPPLFYVVEGLFMFVFGTSMIAGRILVGLFAVLACIYLYRLVQLTHSASHALLTTTLFALAPQFFEYSRYVMLEIPTLALCLASIFHFQRYLRDETLWDSFLACGFAALAGLTRYDAVFLVPYFLIALAFQRRFRLLLRPPSLVAIATGLALVLPYYVYAAHAFGKVHLSSMTHGSHVGAGSLLGWKNWLYYPSCLPGQVGWTVLSLACVALVGYLLRLPRSQALPYLSLAAAVYLTFTPMADNNARHAIYWIPAFCLFAAEALQSIGQWLKAALVLRIVLAFFAVAGTAWSALAAPALYLRGYEEAARYVVQHTRTSPFVLFDNFLSANFIYQVRQHDTERRLWVLRSDKLLYNYIYTPHMGYKEYARSEGDIARLLHKYEPEYIVIERPQLYLRESDLPVSGILYTFVRSNKDRFLLEKVVPLDTNQGALRGAILEIYRNVHRDLDPSRTIELEFPALGRSIEIDIQPVTK